MAWLEFITIGFTFWFIVPTIIVLGLLFYCVAEENPGFAVICTLIYIVLIQVCSDFNFITWISMNTWLFIKYIALYIIIGIAFACVKYWFKLIEKRREFDIAFDGFLKDNHITEKGYTFKSLPEEYQAEAFLKMSYYRLPDIYESTKYITFWMGYWPLVGLWTLINNPLKWFFEEIKHKLSQLFRDTHQKILGDRVDEMQKWREAKEEEQRKILEKRKTSMDKKPGLKDSDWSNS